MIDDRISLQFSQGKKEPINTDADKPIVIGGFQMRKIYYLVTAVLVFSLLVACAYAAAPKSTGHSPWDGNKSFAGGKSYTQTFTPKIVTPSIGIGGKAVKTYEALFTPSTTKPFMGKFKTYTDAFKIPWK